MSHEPPATSASPEAAITGVDVQVYRSARRADTYLFLPEGDDFSTLPQALQDHFGAPTAFLTFLLHEERFLQQADAKQVLAAIAEHGFYLQLPPADEDKQ